MKTPSTSSRCQEEAAASHAPGKTTHLQSPGWNGRASEGRVSLREATPGRSLQHELTPSSLSPLIKSFNECFRLSTCLGTSGQELCKSQHRSLLFTLPSEGDKIFSFAPCVRALANTSPGCDPKSYGDWQLPLTRSVTASHILTYLQGSV